MNVAAVAMRFNKGDVVAELKQKGKHGEVEKVELKGVVVKFDGEKDARHIPYNRLRLVEKFDKTKAKKRRRIVEAKPVIVPAPSLPPKNPEPEPEPVLTDVKTSPLAGRDLDVLNLQPGQQLKMPGVTLEMLPEISPDFAHDLLETRFSRQRRIRQEHVRALSEEMKKGRWRQTGDALKFDKDLQLIDGQHRLSAIVESNMTLKNVLIAIVEDPKAFYSIDQGKVRTLSDVITTAGKSAPPSTVVNAVLYEHFNFKKHLYQGKLSHEDKIKILENFPFIEECYQLVKVKKGKKSIVNAGSLAAAIRCLKVNKDMAMKFFTAVYSLDSTIDGVRVDAAYLLYDWLREIRTNKINTGENIIRESAYKTLRTWNAWRTNETRLTKLQMPRTTENKTFEMPVAHR